MQSIAPRLRSAPAALLAVLAVAAPARAEGVAASPATPAPAAATRVLSSPAALDAAGTRVLTLPAALDARGVAELTADLRAGPSAFLVRGPQTARIAGPVRAEAVDQLARAARAVELDVLLEPAGGERGDAAAYISSLADQVFVSERGPVTVATPERSRGPVQRLLAPAAIALLALLGLVLVRTSRRRRPAPPAAAAPAAPLRAVAASRPERRRRPAIETDPALATSGRGLVRTELHPDGYVELDGCLRRVRWTAPGEPPAVGRHVRVEQQGGRLVADGGKNR